MDKPISETKSNSTNLKNSKFEKNLAEGSVVKQLILFSIPFLLSNLIQSIYNVADMIIVGNFSGKISLSGVNIGGQITFVMTNFIVGLCTGGTVMIAQYSGAKQKSSVQETISTLFTTLAVAAVAITAIMLIFLDPILVAIKTPPDAYSEAKSYLLITACGTIFIFAYNALSSVMRGLGDSKTPLKFVGIACVVNIVLDLLLVGGFDMKAQGAAIATVIAQAISVVLCVVYLTKNKFIFDFKLKSFRFHGEKLKRLMTLGIPAAVQNVIVGMSFIFLTAIVNDTGGVDASAAVGVVGKFNGFAIMPAMAISMSISAMSAQNIGARKLDRAVKTMKIGMLMAISVSVVIFVLAQLFPEQILKLFNDDPAMIKNGIEYIRTFSFDYLVVPFVFSLNGLFIGAGCTGFSLFSSILSSLGLRIPCVFLFGMTLGLGLTGIGAAAPIASLGALICCIVFYLTKKWTRNLNVETEILD